ncbi:lipocalin family protein [Profundibacterium mesophilum]|uniref:Outer membrane lipoprotein Blc n=1 Tax=Profundibacterium mesophilum KAUST100406-0324 TaxID=1037889 RepID=A0A921NT63_9RHOB|nr:lipocalin family protein [Profundibacterium mesophilum]KAF0677585.1 Outer membrane lipoprotein Blc [Profundibacterium mesophilum KAUST100406-0324]
MKKTVYHAAGRSGKRRGAAALAIAALGFLAACAAPDRLAEVVPTPGHRDVTAMISSKAMLAPSRMDGPWHVTGRFPAPAGACVPERFTFAPGRLSLRCTGQGAGDTISAPLAYQGLGRYQADFGAGTGMPSDLWVLWADEGYRTAVIGMPGGEAGWIIDREPGSSADRQAAAREVLLFNGYRAAPLGPP